MNRRFDHVFREAHEAHEKWDKHANLVRDHADKVRRFAFRFAKLVIELQDKHFDAFVRQLQSSKMTVDDWMDQHFGPIEDLGDTRKRLLGAVRAGMTENEYAKAGQMWLISKRLKVPRKTMSTPESPGLNLSKLTPEERAEHFQTEAESRRTQCQSLRRELRETRGDLARAIQENTRLNRVVTRIQRQIHSLKQAEETTAT